MNQFKKVCSVLLVFVMLLSIIPTTVFAIAESSKMSEEFSKVLTDGKLVLNYAKPTSMDDEMVWIAAENFMLNHEDCLLNPDKFTKDFSKIELTMFCFTEKEETHTVDVVWNYDEKIYKRA